MLSFCLIFALIGCRTPISPKPPACPHWTGLELRALECMMEVPAFRPLVEHEKRQNRMCKAIDRMRE
jgi:hypothetical protein